jgi:Putative zinc-binding metallo-peptidase
MISKKRVRRIIKEFNEMFSLEIVINRIVFWNRDGEAEYEYFQDGSCTLKLYPFQNLRGIKEDVYHELGHALIHQYKIPRAYLLQFSKKSPRLSRRTTFLKINIEEAAPPKNFVTWYACVSGQEDFCESLSAYVLNNLKVQGKVYYQNWEHNLNKEPLLKRKFLTIEKLLFEYF